MEGGGGWGGGENNWRVNELLERLEKSFERERRFSADLAHELRTPLAELRAHAEVELQWAEGPGAEKHRETLEIALQMEALVTRFLELARAEGNKTVTQSEPVNLGRMAQEVWQPMQEKARQRGLTVELAVPAEAMLQTDPILFRSILVNLLANAAEYAPDGGQVRITWLGEAGVLTVSNTVRDFTGEDLSHLFERLWRKDKSRTGNVHCGLGLALSQEFARLLGMELTARMEGASVLVFALRI